MKKTFFVKSCACILIAVSLASASFGQQAKPIVFAVLNDGKTLEPIALIDKGKLVATIDGGDENKVKIQFAKTYYKPKTTYRLIFGGASDGVVTVNSSKPTEECVSTLANVSSKPAKAKLGGFVMALATNAPTNAAAKGSRRQPTAGERAEIVSLVRAELSKQKVTADALKNLKFHNMTALDVESDGNAEIVGSALVETSATSRAVLFFIADKNKFGKYAFGFSEFKNVNQDEMMGGSDIKAVDTGIYCELLLDVLEYTGDKTGEIFTYTQGLEGNGFNAYRRSGGKWVRAFEASYYHCAF
ncbi:MAG: hypothetical protein M3384_06330 [Acidobacteriota bacterium]|nr:hypothetical protein [Acidobacteriota bacterium]